MKKNRIVIFIIFFILFSLSGFKYYQSQTDNTDRVVLEQSIKPQVNLVIDDGQKISTFSAISAQNVYEALTKAASGSALKLSVKNYDFGVFVEELAGFKNTSEKAWIYHVNGESGSKAADKYELKNGDLVEWKYIKPIY